MTPEARDLAMWRVEEGSRKDVATTDDPLDGTWTRPDSRLREELWHDGFQWSNLMFLMFTVMFPFMLVIVNVLLAVAVMATATVGGYAAYILHLRRQSAMEAANHKFRVTDEELVVVFGGETVVTSMIPLVDVTDVSVVETKNGRMLGLKSVNIDTPGYGGSAIRGLRNADEVAEAILSRVKKAKAMSRA